MITYLMELKRVLSGDLKILILNIIGFTAMLVLIGLSVSYFMDKMDYENQMADSYQDKVFYKLEYDGDLNDMFDKIFKTDKIINAKKAFDQLDKSLLFEYRYADPQMVAFIDNQNIKYKDEFLDGYETNNVYDAYLSLKAVFADKAFFNENTLSISEGTAFTDKDFAVYDKTNLTLPIVLGYGYKELYQIGDVLHDAQLWDETKVDLKVIGFLNENSYFYNNNNIKILLNRYLIIPSIDVQYDPILESGEIDTFFRGAYDLGKLMNARVICSEHNRSEAINTVNRIMHDNGLYDFFLFDESDGATRALVESKQFSSLGMLITAVTIIICAIMLVLGMLSKLNREKKNYSIYLLLGYEKKRIFHFVAMDTLLIFLISNAAAFSSFIYMKAIKFDESIMDLPVVLSILLMEIALVILAYLLTAMKVFKADLSGIIRGNE